MRKTYVRKAPLAGLNAPGPHPGQPAFLSRSAQGSEHSWELPGLSLWKAPGPPVPLSCAWGPLGCRKQCIVMLASRISFRDPGAGQVFVKTLPREPCAAGQGQALEAAGGERMGRGFCRKWMFSAYWARGLWSPVC